MNRGPLHTALAGEDVGLVTGLTWLPEGVLCELPGSDEHDPASALVAFAVRAGLDFVVVPAEAAWAADAVATLRDVGISALWAIAGPLGRIADRDGWSATLRLSAADPERLAGLLAAAFLDVLADADTGLAVHADALMLADDLAGASGPLLSPEYARDHLVPGYGRVVARAAAAGVFVVFHSDGDTRHLMPALSRQGFAGAHVAGVSDALAAVCHSAAREQGLVVLGGMGAVPCGSDVAQVGLRAARLALSGGAIVCDDGGIASTAELAVYCSALDAARETFARSTP